MVASRITDPGQVLDQFEAFLAQHDSGKSSEPVDPGPRIPFVWPPHAVGRDYHITEKDWTESRRVTLFGEEVTLQIAKNTHGVFGRIEHIWSEAMGSSEADMFENLTKASQPWFDRMDSITKCLGREERYHGNLEDLEADELIMLLFCPNRDVANSAMIEIDKHASSGLYFPAMVRILQDRSHPYRRVGQWCVLDMFEDLPTFCKSKGDQITAISAIKNLIWDSKDDYARVVYKAGVVLGGHICTPESADALLACTEAPYKVGRRSAIHALFHLVEWMPEQKDRVVEQLQKVGSTDPIPELKEFAGLIAADITKGAHDHAIEPVFAEEK